MKKIFTGSDHAGFVLRNHVVSHLRNKGYEVEDLGPPTAERTDYPDHAAKVARAVRSAPGSVGLIMCGSGIGVSIVANKIKGIRAVDAWNVESAQLSRAHNDTNVLCLGERLVPQENALAIVEAWLETEFEGGRHQDRVNKIHDIEESE